MQHPESTPRLYRVHEAARLLGWTEPAVRQAIARGELPAHRIGRRVVIRVADLERLIAGNGAA